MGGRKNCGSATGKQEHEHKHGVQPRMQRGTASRTPWRVREGTGVGPEEAHDHSRAPVGVRHADPPRAYAGYTSDSYNGGGRLRRNLARMFASRG